jgi:MoxR-like ATPase
MEHTEVARLEGSDRFHAAAQLCDRFLENIETVVHGKRDEIKLVLAALLCGGHVLFEDVPARRRRCSLVRSPERSRARRRRASSARRPAADGRHRPLDLQPARADFEFRPGPIFANVVLVDEINRAMPKTQSALLEAMAEHQVTVDGHTRVLPDPFLLIATENPIEYEGTFPLPEAQLDRFFLKTALGYPSTDQELLIVDEQRHGHPLRRLQPVISVEDVHAMREAVMNVYVDPMLQRWIVELVRATRELDEVAVGASVRGSLALERAVRAWALLDRRHSWCPRTSSGCSPPCCCTASSSARRSSPRRGGSGGQRRSRGWRRVLHRGASTGGGSPAEQRAPERLPVGQPTE